MINGVTVRIHYPLYTGMDVYQVVKNKEIISHKCKDFVYPLFWYLFNYKETGAGSIYICRLCSISMEIPIIKIRRSYNRVIFIVGISVLAKLCIYPESAHRLQWCQKGKWTCHLGMGWKGKMPTAFTFKICTRFCSVNVLYKNLTCFILPYFVLNGTSHYLVSVLDMLSGELMGYIMISNIWTYLNWWAPGIFERNYISINSSWFHWLVVEVSLAKLLSDPEVTEPCSW